MESLLERKPDPRHNLPARLTSFIGRERELARVTQLLESHRLITLTGPGGCGKTRLGLEVVSRTVPGFPGGIHFVSLAALSDPGLVTSTVAEALEIRETTGQPLVQSV